MTEGEIGRKNKERSENILKDRGKKKSKKKGVGYNEMTEDWIVTLIILAHPQFQTS